MTIGLFAPLPLAMMIPFMAAQSAAMAQAFGTHFQYGKRKISSMSNEEFNKTTPEMLFKGLNEDLKHFVPHIQKSIQDMSDFQQQIVQQIIVEISKLPSSIVSGVQQASGTTGGAPFGVAALVNPQGIAANADLWASIGLISQNQAELIKQQTDQALSEANARTEADKEAERRANEARLGATERASTRKKIQLPTLVTGTVTEKGVAAANKKVLQQSINNIMRQISTLQNKFKAQQVRKARAQSSKNAILKILPRTTNKNSIAQFKRSLQKNNTDIVNASQQMQQILSEIGTKNVLLAKTKRFQT